MAAITYKPASEKDIPRLVALDKKAFSREFDNNFTALEFREIFKNKGKTGFIYYGKRCAGYYAYTELSEQEGEILAIALIPGYTGKGVGSECMTMIIKKLAHKKKIKSVAHPKNIASLIMCLKQGFVVTGYVKDYYGLNQPRVILHKNN